MEIFFWIIGIVILLIMWIYGLWILEKVWELYFGDWINNDYENRSKKRLKFVAWSLPLLIVLIIILYLIQ